MSCKKEVCFGAFDMIFAENTKEGNGLVLAGNGRFGVFSEEKSDFLASANSLKNSCRNQGGLNPSRICG
jgi:hypothetical protein